MFCCKLMGWVWTKTGIGDRLGGDRRVGPSPFSDRPAPPHSLHNLTRPDRGQPASCTDLLLYCILPGLRLSCHALPAFALPKYLPMPLFALSFTFTMCSRTIAESVLQGLPCRQPHYRELHLSSPDTSLLLHVSQFKWTGDCTEQPGALVA